MKLVLDTNVVLDLLHWKDPRCAALAEALAAGRARCFTDDACLAELERVLAYPQFALDAGAQRALADGYRQRATIVAAGEEIPPALLATIAALPRCRDADDQKFLQLAARCGADLLLTRDRELLRLACSRRHPPPFAIAVPEQAAARLAAATSPAPEPPP